MRFEGRKYKNQLVTSRKYFFMQKKSYHIQFVNILSKTKYLMFECTKIESSSENTSLFNMFTMELL